MRTTSAEALKQFEEFYTRFAKLKKQGLIYKGDVEPTPEQFGLHPMIGQGVKARIDREMARTA